MKVTSAVVALSLVLVGQQADDLDVITLNGMDCPLQGTAKSPDVKALNKKKGRYHLPASSQIDPAVTLTAMASPGDDENRFDDRSAATVIGYVLQVGVGGNETCNCKATNPDERDTHIALTLSEMPLNDENKKQSVVAEVSPRTRIVRRRTANKNDWTTAKLKESIAGKWVKITGWLLFDFEHIHEAENTNPGNSRNWRATCWEIHPVTQIEVLDGPPNSGFALDPKILPALQRAHAAHVDAVPERRRAINDRNEKLRARIGPDDRDELEENGNH